MRTCPGGFIYTADCSCRHCTRRCLCEPSHFRVVNVTRGGTSRVADYFGAQNTGSKPEMRLKDAFLPPADDPQF